MVPPPPAATGGPLRALIYDSVYDEYKVRGGSNALMLGGTIVMEDKAGRIACPRCVQYNKPEMEVVWLVWPYQNIYLSV